MRTQTVYADNKEEAQQLMPWSSVIVQVEGEDNTFKRCWMGFESVTDFETWDNQK